MTRYKKSFICYIAVFTLFIALAISFFCPVKNASAMQIFFKVSTDANATHALEVEPNDSIGAIKAKVQEFTSIPTDTFVIVFAGKIIADVHKTLSDYNIQKESTIHVVIRTEKNSCHETENCPGIYINGKCGVCGLDKTTIPDPPEQNGPPVSNETPIETQPTVNKDWILPVAIGGGVAVLGVTTLIIVVSRKKR